MNDTTNMIKSYKGKNIRINPVTKYVCLTDMASASSKQIGHWIELKGATEYLKAFELAVGIPIETLLCVGELL